jgi:Cell wall-active antibiotics response 4TMS YvqF
VTFAVLLLAAGTAAILDAVGLVDMDVRAYLALAMTVVGVGLVAGAWIGRARWLIAIGLLLVPPLLVAGAIQGSLRDGGPADRVVAPASLSQVESTYSYPAGQLTIDLSKVDFGPDGTHVDASLGIGQLVVIVPDDVTVEMDAQVGAGRADLLGRRFGDQRRFDADGDGPGVDELVTSAGSAEGGRLRLDLHTGLGEIVVRRAP